MADRVWYGMVGSVENWWVQVWLVLADRVWKGQVRFVKVRFVLVGSERFNYQNGIIERKNHYPKLFKINTLNMDPVPSAYEFYSQCRKDWGENQVDPIKFAKEFAKLHVHAAIEKIESLPNIKLGGDVLAGAINRYQITHAYPLTNIK